VTEEDCPPRLLLPFPLVKQPGLTQVLARGWGTTFGRRNESLLSWTFLLFGGKVCIQRKSISPSAQNWVSPLDASLSQVDGFHPINLGKASLFFFFFSFLGKVARNVRRCPPFPTLFSFSFAINCGFLVYVGRDFPKFHFGDLGNFGSPPAISRSLEVVK